jgi:3-dehydro-L-gulonate 2-dehydrogenase
MLRLSFETIQTQLVTILSAAGFDPSRADKCSRLFTEASCDGVQSHGLNRFPRFIETIRSALVDPGAEPELVDSFGALERWDGKSGAGNLNAHASMERAILLAEKNGIGAVALRNTNHWMRGGTYGWQAADAGVIGICWTNTLPNLPPWGGTRPTIGNNPLVFAVPRAGGHIVLDMAMSQFSFGALESYRKREQLLPVPGGFNSDGELTLDPRAIEESGRPLPIGYWKGSGLALMLDCLASILAAGEATCSKTTEVVKETGLCQVFIAFNATLDERERHLAAILEFLKSSADTGVRYPGERTAAIRKENLQLGIPVDPEVWEQIKNL